MPTPDFRPIATRAAGIYDRASHVTPGSAICAGTDPNPSAIAALRAWQQAFSGHDEAAFLHRLAWDHLDRSVVLAAAAEPGPAAGDAAWIGWLERSGAAAIEVLAEWSSGRFVTDPALDVPFVEVWTAFERAASAAVGQTHDWSARLGPGACEALRRQLCLELSRQGELALFEMFRTAAVSPPAADVSPGQSNYRACVGSWLSAGLAPLWEEYPALARLAAGITGDWVDATREFLERLDVDRPGIAATFGDDPGLVTSIEPGVSDPHHGRRRVALVDFASGLRLVYKPRSIRIDASFNRILGWMNESLAVPLRTLRVLDRGSHGWVEFAAHAPVADRPGAARAYRQAGALMCVASLLGAQDLHMENVVATAEGPVLVDTEMLFQPVVASPMGGGADAEVPPERVAVSVLDSGLLSLITVTAEGDVYDSGGLRGQVSGPLPFPRRVWRALRTDALAYDDQPTYTSAARHQVVLDGVAQDPGDYAADLRAGFAEAYRAVIDRRASLISPDGPLQSSAGAVRVTMRPTNQYAMLHVVLTAPKYLRSGVPRSTAVDVLHRGWAGRVDAPDLWPVAVEERRAIDRLDVPYFDVDCTGTDVSSDGRVIVRGHFVASGLSAAIARAHAWSEADLNAQEAQLMRALGERVTSRFPDPAPDPVGDEPRALAYARWIAHALLARAERTDEGLIWRHDLRSGAQGWSRHQIYDGTLGPVLFFAALAAATGDAAWNGHAQDALRPLRAELDRGLPAPHPGTQNIGGVGGLGSIAYGLTVASTLLDDAGLLDLAAGVARAMAPGIETDDHLDVLDGAAGAALALMALADAAPHTEALRLAVTCGDRLLATAVSSPDGLAWPAPDGSWLTGFAHGAAGISTALARLARVTGADRFRHAARLGCRFIERQYLAAGGNYAIAGPGPGRGAEGRPAMLAWCHGAPGIVVGMGAQLDFCPETAILSQFEAALATMSRDRPAQVDHLCCGAHGRVEALLTAGRALGRSELVEDAWRLADAIATRAAARGHFRLSGAGMEYRVFDPGFFRGLSGIGYQWLRLSSPALPSIAGLEPVSPRVPRVSRGAAPAEPIRDRNL